MTLVLAVIPYTSASPAIQFFSFLPVVFFMFAHEHEKSEKTIRELRERVAALEAGPPPAPAAPAPRRE